ncbi:MAG: hypothetical protein PVF10_10560 [Syntrophobacterales bacterium]|jgi:hypothetical protein
MKKSLFLILLMAGVLASILVMSRHASAATLLAYDGNASGLYSIDTATAIATLIGTDFASEYISEIELSAAGVVYAADTDDNTLLHTIDPSTGSVTGTITLTFPMGGDVLTALEFVGSTLYAGFTTEGSGGPTFLTTVDIGTGIVSTVGATGVSSPLGGLAYDVATSVMYGISAGGSSPQLFTIDLSTGAATSVGLVTIGGETFGGTTALEFGPDGVLYALPNNNSDITGHLLSIDPLTCAATDLGFTGAESLNALTAEYASVTLGADFGASGLYTYDGTTWNRINSNNPAGLGAYSSKLVANFPGMGLYEYDGTDWLRINTNDGAENMCAVGSTLYVDFGATGLYAYDGSSWGRIVRMDASALASFDGKLAVNFPGRGLYVYDGGWSRITKNDTAENMIGLGSMLYVEFSNGLWQYNGTSFSRLTRWDVSSLATYDNKLAVNFPGHGLYEYDGSWSRINKNDTAQGMCGVGVNLYVDFGATGLYRYDGSNFQRVSTNNCEDMVAAELL